MAELQLAFCDSACPNNTANPFINKIGGLPDFFPSVCLAAPPTCNVCGSPLILLVQMYCPLEGSPYHRLFHLFCCSSSSCWSNADSWQVLRSQQIEEPTKPLETPVPVSNVSLSAQEWCEDADDWEGSELDTLAIASTQTTTVSDISIQSEQADTSSSTDGLAVDLLALKLSTSNYTAPFYPPFFMNVYAENDVISYQQLPSNYDGAFNITDLSNSEIIDSTDKAISSTGEVYEQSMAKHGDRAFMKFKKEISKCPNQIIRYLKGGTPLLSSDCFTAVSLTSVKCKHCGSSCSMEFQVMPQLVYILQESLRSHTQSLQAVEFGTVLVFTCDRSCWVDGRAGNGFIQETVFVQPEIFEAL